MKSRKTPLLEERVQRERDRAADKYDPMLREIRDLRNRNKGATDVWNRKRTKSSCNEGEQELHILSDRK